MAGLGSGPLLLMAMTLLLTVAPLTAAPYLKTAGGDAQKQLPLDEIFRPSQGLIGPLFRQNDHSLNPPTQGGCFYQFRHYDEGDRIITNEPCLNCTCHNSMLMCYLKVCPFSKPIGQDCTVEKSPDQCCPVITCPQVPVNLQVMQMMSTSTTSSPTTEIMPYTEHGCTIDGEFYTDGVQVPGDPNKPCELCYCIRNHTACLMQECILKVEGCKPVFEDGVCCPIRYKCVHDKYPLEITTTTLAPNGSLIATTLMPPTSKGCVYQNEYYADGASIPSTDPCEHCYCMNDDIVCAIQECRSPLDEENEHCTPQPPPPGACCAEAYDCPEVPETTTLIGVEYTTLSTDMATSPEKVEESTDETSSEKEIDEGMTTVAAEVDEEIDETSSMMTVTQPTKKNVTDTTEKMEEVSVTEKVEEASTEFPFTVMKEVGEALENETETTDSMLTQPETVPESADSKTTAPALDVTTDTSIEDEDGIMKETSPEEPLTTEESVMMDDVPSDDQTDYQFDVDEKPKPEDFMTTVKPMVDDLVVMKEDGTVTDKLPDVVTAEIVTTKIEETTVSSVATTNITSQDEGTTKETVSEATKRPDISSLETRITQPESETATATESMVDEAVSEATTMRPVEGDEMIPEDITSKQPEGMIDSEITTQTTDVSTDEIVMDYTTSVDSLIRPKPEVDTVPESPEMVTDKPDDTETFEAIDEVIDELTSLQPPKTTDESIDMDVSMTKIPSILTDDKDKVTSVTVATPEDEEKTTSLPIKDTTTEPELASTYLLPQITTESDIALTDAPTELTTSQDELPKIDNTTETIMTKEECIQDGIYYKHGDFIPKPDPCNICRCMNGMQKCEIIKCPPPEEFTNCKKELKPNQCCPTYTCIDSDNMIVIPEGMLPSHQLVIDEETATEEEVEMPTESPVPVEEKDSIEPEMDISTSIPPAETSTESISTESSITTLDSDIADSEVETTTSIDSLSTDIDDLSEMELTTAIDQLISTEMTTEEISTDTSTLTEKLPEVISSSTMAEESVPDDVSTPIPYPTDLVTEKETVIVDTTASQEIESTTVSDEQTTTSKYDPVTSLFEEETEPGKSTTVSPDAIDEVTDMIEKVTEEHTDVPEQVTEKFTDVSKQVTEKFTDVPEQVTEEYTDVPEQVTEESTDVPEQVTEEFTDVPEQVTEEYTDVPEQVTEESTDVPEQVTEEFTDVPEQVTELHTDLPEQATEGFTDVSEQVTEVHTDVTEQVTEGFTDSPEKVTEAHTDLPEKEITTSKSEESTTSDTFDTDESTTQKEETTEEIISPETESPVVSATTMPAIVPETETATKTADISDETTQSAEVSDKTTQPAKPSEELTTQFPGVSEEETTKEAESETSDISTQIPEVTSSPSSEPIGEKEDTTYEPGQELASSTLIPESQTEIPGIPGEGNCNVNGSVYLDEAIVPVTNKCQVQCRCKNSQVKCTLAACPPAPPTFLRCNSDQKSDECCPTFECADISSTETPSPNCVRDGNQYMEGDYVPSKDLCTDCFCIGGEIVCAVLECKIPHHSCVAIRSSSVQEMCCPDMFECPEPVLSLPMDDGDTAETDSSIFPLSSKPITPAGPYTNETDESASQNVTFPDSQTESFNDTFTMKPLTLITDVTTSEISLSETTETPTLPETKTEEYITGEQVTTIPLTAIPDTLKPFEITTEPTIDPETILPHITKTYSDTTDPEVITDGTVFPRTDFPSEVLTTEPTPSITEYPSITEPYDEDIRIALTEKEPHEISKPTEKIPSGDLVTDLTREDHTFRPIIFPTDKPMKPEIIPPYKLVTPDTDEVRTFKPIIFPTDKPMKPTVRPSEPPTELITEKIYTTYEPDKREEEISTTEEPFDLFTLKDDIPISLDVSTDLPVAIINQTDSVIDRTTEMSTSTSADIDDEIFRTDKPFDPFSLEPVIADSLEPTTKLPELTTDDFDTIDTLTELPIDVKRDDPDTSDVQTEKIDLTKTSLLTTRETTSTPAYEDSSSSELPITVISDLPTSTESEIMHMTETEKSYPTDIELTKYPQAVSTKEIYEFTTIQDLDKATTKIRMAATDPTIIPDSSTFLYTYPVPKSEVPISLDTTVRPLINESELIFVTDRVIEEKATSSTTEVDIEKDSELPSDKPKTYRPETSTDKTGIPATEQYDETSTIDPYRDVVTIVDEPVYTSARSPDILDLMDTTTKISETSMLPKQMINETVITTELPKIYINETESLIDETTKISLTTDDSLDSYTSKTDIFISVDTSTTVTELTTNETDISVGIVTDDDILSITEADDFGTETEKSFSPEMGLPKTTYSDLTETPTTSVYDSTSTSRVPIDAQTEASTISKTETTDVTSTEKIYSNKTEIPIITIQTVDESTSIPTDDEYITKTEYASTSPKTTTETSTFYYTYIVPKSELPVSLESTTDSLIRETETSSATDSTKIEQTISTSTPITEVPTDKTGITATEQYDETSTIDPTEKTTTIVEELIGISTRSSDILDLKDTPTKIPETSMLPKQMINETVITTELPKIYINETESIFDETTEISLITDDPLDSHTSKTDVFVSVDTSTTLTELTTNETDMTVGIVTDQEYTVSITETDVFDTHTEKSFLPEIRLPKTTYSDLTETPTTSVYDSTSISEIPIDVQTEVSTISKTETTDITSTEKIYSDKTELPIITTQEVDESTSMPTDDENITKTEYASTSPKTTTETSTFYYTYIIPKSELPVSLESTTDSLISETETSFTTESTTLAQTPSTYAPITANETIPEEEDPTQPEIDKSTEFRPILFPTEKPILTVTDHSTDILTKITDETYKPYTTKLFIDSVSETTTDSELKTKQMTDESYTLQPTTDSEDISTEFSETTRKVYSTIDLTTEATFIPKLEENDTSITEEPYQEYTLKPFVKELEETSTALDSLPTATEIPSDVTTFILFPEDTDEATSQTDVPIETSTKLVEALINETKLSFDVEGTTTKTEAEKKIRTEEPYDIYTQAPEIKHFEEISTTSLEHILNDTVEITTLTDFVDEKIRTDEPSEIFTSIPDIEEPEKISTKIPEETVDIIGTSTEYVTDKPSGVGIMITVTTDMDQENVTSSYKPYTRGPDTLEADKYRTEKPLVLDSDEITTKIPTIPIEETEVSIEMTDLSIMEDDEISKTDKPYAPYTQKPDIDHFIELSTKLTEPFTNETDIIFDATDKTSTVKDFDVELSLSTIEPHDVKTLIPDTFDLVETSTLQPDLVQTKTEIPFDTKTDIPIDSYTHTSDIQEDKLSTKLPEPTIRDEKIDITDVKSKVTAETTTLPVTKTEYIATTPSIVTPDTFKPFDATTDPVIDEETILPRITKTYPETTDPEIMTEETVFSRTDFPSEVLTTTEYPSITEPHDEDIRIPSTDKEPLEISRPTEKIPSGDLVTDLPREDHTFRPIIFPTDKPDEVRTFKPIIFPTDKPMKPTIRPSEPPTELVTKKIYTTYEPDKREEEISTTEEPFDLFTLKDNISISLDVTTDLTEAKINQTDSVIDITTEMSSSTIADIDEEEILRTDKPFDPFGLEPVIDDSVEQTTKLPELTTDDFDGIDTLTELPADIETDDPSRLDLQTEKTYFTKSTSATTEDTSTLKYEHISTSDSSYDRTDLPTSSVSLEDDMITEKSFTPAISLDYETSTIEELLTITHKDIPIIPKFTKDDEPIQTESESTVEDGFTTEITTDFSSIKTKYKITNQTEYPTTVPTTTDDSSTFYYTYIIPKSESPVGLDTAEQLESTTEIFISPDQTIAPDSESLKPLEQVESTTFKIPIEETMYHDFESQTTVRDSEKLLTTEHPSYTSVDEIIKLINESEVTTRLQPDREEFTTTAYPLDEDTTKLSTDNITMSTDLIKHLTTDKMYVGVTEEDIEKYTSMPTTDDMEITVHVTSSPKETLVEDQETATLDYEFLPTVRELETYTTKVIAKPSTESISELQELTTIVSIDKDTDPTSAEHTITQTTISPDVSIDIETTEGDVPDSELPTELHIESTTLEKIDIPTVLPESADIEITETTTQYLDTEQDKSMTDSENTTYVEVGNTTLSTTELDEVVTVLSLDNETLETRQEFDTSTHSKTQPPTTYAYATDFAISDTTETDIFIHVQPEVEISIQLQESNHTTPVETQTSKLDIQDVTLQDDIEMLTSKEPSLVTTTEPEIDTYSYTTLRPIFFPTEPSTTKGHIAPIPTVQDNTTQYHPILFPTKKPSMDHISTTRVPTTSKSDVEASTIPDSPIDIDTLEPHLVYTEPSTSVEIDYADTSTPRLLRVDDIIDPLNDTDTTQTTETTKSFMSTTLTHSTYSDLITDLHDYDTADTTPSKDLFTSETTLAVDLIDQTTEPHSTDVISTDQTTFVEDVSFRPVTRGYIPPIEVQTASEIPYTIDTLLKEDSTHTVTDTYTEEQNRTTTESYTEKVKSQTDFPFLLETDTEFVVTTIDSSTYIPESALPTDMEKIIPDTSQTDSDVEIHSLQTESSLTSTFETEKTGVDELETEKTTVKVDSTEADFDAKTTVMTTSVDDTETQTIMSTESQTLSKEESTLPTEVPHKPEEETEDVFSSTAIYDGVDYGTTLHPEEEYFTESSIDSDKYTTMVSTDVEKTTTLDEAEIPTTESKAEMPTTVKSEESSTIFVPELVDITTPDGTEVDSELTSESTSEFETSSDVLLESSTKQPVTKDTTSDISDDMVTTTDFSEVITITTGVDDDTQSAVSDIMTTPYPYATDQSVTTPQEEMIEPTTSKEADTTTEASLEEIVTESELVSKPPDDEEVTSMLPPVTDKASTEMEETATTKIYDSTETSEPEAEITTIQTEQDTQTQVPEIEISTTKIEDLQTEVPDIEMSTPKIEELLTPAPEMEMSTAKIEDVQTPVPDVEMSTTEIEESQTPVPEVEMTTTEMDDLQTQVPDVEISTTQTEDLQTSAPEAEMSTTKIEDLQTPMPEVEMSTVKIDDDLQTTVPEIETSTSIFDKESTLSDKDLVTTDSSFVPTETPTQESVTEIDETTAPIKTDVPLVTSTSAPVDSVTIETETESIDSSDISTSSFMTTTSSIIDEQSTLKPGLNETEDVETITEGPTVQTTMFDILATTEPVTEPDEIESKTTTAVEISPVTSTAKPDSSVGITEGCWWHDNEVYEHGNTVPSVDKCQENCKCINGSVQCERIGCPPVPASFLRCVSSPSNDSCCPVFECEHEQDDETCQYEGKTYYHEERIPSGTLCKECWCLKGEIKCAFMECSLPNTNCTAIEQRSTDCCPSRFVCSEELPQFSVMHTDKPLVMDSIHTITDKPVTEVTSIESKSSPEPTTTLPEDMDTSQETYTDKPTTASKAPLSSTTYATTPKQTIIEFPEDDAPSETYIPPGSGNETTTWQPSTTTELVVGPGSCLFDGKVYVSAKQIPRDDPCDFCFCFRGDIICLQQTCPPPIPGCYEEAIPGFCCPRYECPVTQSYVNVTTTTPSPFPGFPPSQKTSRIAMCEIEGKHYASGELVMSASSPCHECKCGGDGFMKCMPKECDSNRKVYKHGYR